MKPHYKSLLSAGLVLLFMQFVSAQRIRKDHREMSPAEKTAYLNAIVRLQPTIMDMAAMHEEHFGTDIHSTNTGDGTQFLPWHRMFLFEMEDYVKGVGSASQPLCIPYWDWRVENTSTNVTWDDNGFLSLSSLNQNGFNLTRSLGGTLATASNISSLMALTSFLPSPPQFNGDNTTSSFFGKRLEGWHNLGHNFVGGTMLGGQSPRDPVFFLHHGFVDKLWQDWEDRENSVKSTFPEPDAIIDHWPLVSPNDIEDSRYMKYQPINTSTVVDEDVWYAYNRKLLLDGLNGTFNVTGTNRVYCYTAWNGSSLEGEIYAGDVMRNSSDGIVADSKGGFTVKSGAQCAFNAGRNVYLRPGFQAEAGAEFRASIVTSGCTASQSIVKQDKSEGGNKHSHPADAGDDLLNMTKIHVYKNRMSDVAAISYMVPVNSRVLIEIYNNAGQHVISAVNENQLAGVYRVEASMAGLPQGLYFCRFITDHIQKTVKFINQHP